VERIHSEGWCRPLQSRATRARVGGLGSTEEDRPTIVTRRPQQAPRDSMRPGREDRERIIVEPLPGPDDFADLFGTAKWKKSAQEYKEELRRMWGD